MVRDFRGVQFYSPALPRLPAHKRRLSATPYCSHNHTQTKHTPSVDWPTVHQNNPVIGQIYHTVVDQTPAPTPETLATRTAEVKNLYSQRSCSKFPIKGFSTAYSPIITPAKRTTRLSYPPRSTVRSPMTSLRVLRAPRTPQAKILLRKRFFFPGWSLDLELTKRSCSPCAQFHHSAHTIPS